MAPQAVVIHKTEYGVGQPYLDVGMKAPLVQAIGSQPDDCNCIIIGVEEHRLLVLSG